MSRFALWVMVGGLVLALGTAAEATVEPVIVNGDFTLADGEPFNVRIMGETADLLTCTGAATLSANTSLNVIPVGGGHEFKAGTYKLIEAAGGVNGTFTNTSYLVGYVTGDGLTYDAAGGTVTLTLDKNLIPGDGSLDGQTDVSDRIIWNINGFGSGKTFTTGDYNNDGVTDVSDRIVYIMHRYTIASADPLPDVGYEGPSPEFTYDVETGVMTVTPNGHFITDLVVHGVEAEASLLPTGLVFNDRGDISIWEGRNFGGSFQALDQVATGRGDVGSLLARFAPGLRAADFGQVEWAAALASQEPGEGGWAEVTVVPEPATMTMLCLGGMLLLRRRHGKGAVQR